MHLPAACWVTWGWTGRPAEHKQDKAAQLYRLGVTVAERVPTAAHFNAINARYLAPKAGEARTHAGPPVQ
jgi:hypothetical protein